MLIETKCSGTKPRCSNCEAKNEDCVYDLARRDRLREALQRNEVLTALLSEIRDSLSDEKSKRIDDVLKEFEDDTQAATPLITQLLSKRVKDVSLPDRQRPGAPSQKDTQASPFSITISSQADLYHSDEDLLDDEDGYEARYVGSISQSQWLRTLQMQLSQLRNQSSGVIQSPQVDGEDRFASFTQTASGTQRQSIDGVHLSEHSYYLDDTVRDAENIIEDPHKLPSAGVALHLFDVFKRMVHDPFRIIANDFEGQLRAYFEALQYNDSMSVTAEWKAILNLVFAIAARYLQLISTDQPANENDHDTYKSRAIHFLEPKCVITVSSAPDIALIQATGLLSFYYLAVGHVSRAWHMIGISLRYAQAAGLHLRNDDPHISKSREIAQAQTWWGLHSIECELTGITGRPRVINMSDCTVPLTTGFSKDSLAKAESSRQAKFRARDVPYGSAAGYRIAQDQTELETAKALDAFVAAYANLNFIHHKVLSNLYTVRPIGQGWHRVRKQIATFTADLSSWASLALPSEPSRETPTSKSSLGRTHWVLFFCYHSVKICITWPCLCRLDRRTNAPHGGSAEFDQTMAIACIQAALDLTSLLPETPNPQWIYAQGPWWSIVHIIMQAMTVLLLESAQGATRSLVNPSSISMSIERLLQCLKALSFNDAVSRRAHKIIYNVLGRNELSERDRATPRQWEDELEKGKTNQSIASMAAPPMYNEPNALYFQETSWTRQNMLDAADVQAADDFDLSAMQWPPNDPMFGYQIGQAQLPLYFGNQFRNDFTQDTDHHDPSSDLHGHHQFPR